MRGELGNAGFSVAEPLVALVLLGIGLTGTLGTLILATRIHAGSRLTEQAVARGAEIADSLRLVGGGSGEVEEEGWQIRWDTSPGAWGRVEVVRRGGGGPGARVALLEVRVPPVRGEGGGGLEGGP